MNGPFIGFKWHTRFDIEELRLYHSSESDRGHHKDTEELEADGKPLASSETRVLRTEVLREFLPQHVREPFRKPKGTNRGETRNSVR